MTTCCFKNLRQRLTFAFVVGLCGVGSPVAWAHGDEPHDEPESKAAVSMPSVGGDSRPTRLADGSLWVPKPVQHRLQIRTVRPQQQAHPRSIELNGRVVADPNAGGRVQASQAGRIEAGPQGLPGLGQRVKKGQILAYLQPSVTNLDRGNQQSALADIDAQLALANARVQRYEQLDGAIARKDIESARVERDALRQRRAALSDGLRAPEALRAPVDGVVVASSVELGQVVDSKDTLFEVVDPARLVIEALLYDMRWAGTLSRASAMVPGGVVQLQWQGTGAQLREQAMPVRFKVISPTVPLAVGQSVKVTATTAESVKGWAVPREALGKTASGEAMVWVHVEAERFRPQVIRFEPLDATQVVVTSGLHEGDRVVSRGASLLTQIR